MNNSIFDFNNIELNDLNDKVSFSGYASVFDVKDYHNDIIQHDAFKNLSDTLILLWQHDQQNPIGKITKLSQDSYGLYIEGFITNKTQKGTEAINLLEQGILESLSIGYNILDYFTMLDTNYITALELVEISLVSIPANPKTSISLKKSIIARIDEILMKLSS